MYLKRKAVAELVLRDLAETIRNSTNIILALTTVVAIMREHVRYSGEWRPSETAPISDRPLPQWSPS